jgi:uncharacterized RDD family membrane protein YckC
MARFCPYCGKQLSDRAKFCPHCGKAPPRRQRQPGVAVEEASDRWAQAPGSSSEAGQKHAAGAESGKNVPVTRAIAAEPERQASRAAGPTHGNGAGARPIITTGGQRRVARPTRVIAGPEEQAGFGLRYGAWMFDFLITLIAMMTFTFVITAVSNRSVVGSNRDLVIVSLLSLLLFVLNFVVLAGRDGQSAGMRILGIRIARVDGEPFTVRDAALRHLVGYPISMAAFFLGFLWMLWDPRQQGWHDKIARTVVVISR